MVQRQFQAPEASSSAAGEDFVPIKGIGPATQARLHEAGILTLAQLSLASPEKIAAVTGISTKHVVREDWTGQARRLADRRAAHQEPEIREGRSEIHEHRVAFTVELLLDEDNNVLQTHIRHHQEDVEETWNGWVEPRFVNFFVRYAGLHRPLPEIHSPIESIHALEAPRFSETSSSPVGPPETRIVERFPHSKLKRVLSGVVIVKGLSTVRLDSDVPQPVVRANETFKVQLHLDLSRVKTSPSRPLDCNVTIWARELGTGARQIAGEWQSKLMPIGQIPCIVESKISLPGPYRLEGVATLTLSASTPAPDSTLWAWFESGLLQVY